jgi:cytochrome c biogenesis factor
MKNFFNLILYFILAVVFFGGSGVWMPFVLDKISQKDFEIGYIYQNLSTYFIAIIAAGCIDLILITMNSSKLKNKIGIILAILILLFGSLVFVGLDFYWILNNETEKSTLAIIAGIFVAFLLWWISNWKSKHINPFNALGGDAS